MTEIIPNDSTGWVFQSSGNPTPNPIVMTLAQYKAAAPFDLNGDHFEEGDAFDVPTGYSYNFV